MPTADTFSCKPIGEFVDKYNTGVSVDPFARNSQKGTHTNDLNPETSAMSHMDARDYLQMLHDNELCADTVIFDPPYSPRQISECYGGVGIDVSMEDTQSRFWTECKTKIRQICYPGTIVLSFGWNSGGMGTGFEMLEIMLVAHGGWHNDTICLAERMVEKQEKLF